MNCHGTRHCLHAPARTCDRCGLVLCDGKESHWRGTYCLRGGAHKDAAGAAKIAPEPKNVPRLPDVNVWITTPANAVQSRPKDRPLATYTGGRGAVRNDAKRAAILAAIHAGKTAAQIAAELHTSLTTIASVRAEHKVTQRNGKRSRWEGRTA